jgi:hypothetical protein
MRAIAGSFIAVLALTLNTLTLGCLLRTSCIDRLGRRGAGAQNKSQ